MLKMILADDEPMITRGIQLLLDWQALGIEIVATYSDGKSAMQGILEHEPDLAILDISMPGKTGIDILKDLKNLKSKTKVIFLSGFQDFSYAQAALRYGASDYLLKPVKKDSLLQAITKCTNKRANITPQPHLPEESPFVDRSVYQKLSGIVGREYMLVVAEFILPPEKDGLEQDLIRFAANSVIDDFLKRTKAGVAFQRDKKTCILFKDEDTVYVHDALMGLHAAICGQCNCKCGFVTSRMTEDVTNLPMMFQRCLPMLEYFYFYSLLPSYIIEEGKSVFQNEPSAEEIWRLRENLAECVLSQEIGQLDAKVNAFFDMVGIAADGTKETAVYFCISCLRYIDTEMKRRLYSDTLLIKENVLMEQLHAAKSYENLRELVRLQIKILSEHVLAALQISGKQDVVKAVQYINDHYAENLSLDILAKYIHMNSFYFSTFFKKQTGKNFKDYLNQVRMNRAMELLMTTNKKSYEIADEVGFKDYRYFNEIFSRHYGKTPTVYRKAIMKGGEEADELQAKAAKKQV
ncbi:MAG: response regulator [Faecalibacterium sp.]